MLVPLEGGRVEEVAGGDLQLSFLLPSGSYATIVLREICKGSGGLARSRS